MTHYAPSCGGFENCSGPFNSLWNHACSDNGMISDCCGYSPENGGCMVLRYGEFAYPCFDNDGADSEESEESMEESSASCVNVNHIYDNPGFYTCECVDPNESCIYSGDCVAEDACPSSDGQANADDCMSQWCPADDWDIDTLITKICVKTKVALGIADDADCSTATPLASADGDEWESDEEDSTVCDITSPDLVASECTGEGATFTVDTC